MHLGSTGDQIQVTRCACNTASRFHDGTDKSDRSAPARRRDRRRKYHGYGTTRQNKPTHPTHNAALHRYTRICAHLKAPSAAVHRRLRASADACLGNAKLITLMIGFGRQKACACASWRQMCSLREFLVKQSVGRIVGTCGWCWQSVAVEPGRWTQSFAVPRAAGRFRNCVLGRNVGAMTFARGCASSHWLYRRESVALESQCEIFRAMTINARRCISRAGSAAPASRIPSAH